MNGIKQYDKLARVLAYILPSNHLRWDSFYSILYRTIPSMEDN